MSYVKTSKGYKFVERDDTPPEPRRCCAGCGEELPEGFWDEGPTGPEQVEHLVPERVRVGRVTHLTTRRATQEEIGKGEAERFVRGPWWDCPHCGYGHVPDEMFTL